MMKLRSAFCARMSPQRDSGSHGDYFTIGIAEDRASGALPAHSGSLGTGLLAGAHQRGVDFR